MERVMRLLNADILPGRSGVDLGRAFHVQGQVRSFVVKFLNKSVELSLLLQDIGVLPASWPVVSESDASVHAGRSAADELGRRLDELLRKTVDAYMKRVANKRLLAKIEDAAGSTEIHKGSVDRARIKAMDDLRIAIILQGRIRGTSPGDQIWGNQPVFVSQR
jgi:hypothetical protein